MQLTIRGYRGRSSSRSAAAADTESISAAAADYGESPFSPAAA
jgi:hypothetical protein